MNKVEIFINNCKVSTNELEEYSSCLDKVEVRSELSSVQDLQKLLLLIDSKLKINGLICFNHLQQTKTNFLRIPNDLLMHCFSLLLSDRYSIIKRNNIKESFYFTAKKNIKVKTVNNIKKLLIATFEDNLKIQIENEIKIEFINLSCFKCSDSNTILFSKLEISSDSDEIMISKECVSARDLINLVKNSELSEIKVLVDNSCLLNNNKNYNILAFKITKDIYSELGLSNLNTDMDDYFDRFIQLAKLHYKKIIYIKTNIDGNISIKKVDYKDLPENLEYLRKLNFLSIFNFKLYSRQDLIKNLTFETKEKNLNVELNNLNINFIIYLLKMSKFIIRDHNINIKISDSQLLNKVLKYCYDITNFYVINVFKVGNFFIINLNPIKTTNKTIKNNTGWSFGIITDGKNDYGVEKQIKSIELLNIKNYEIIICGLYSGYSNKNTKIIKYENNENNDIRPWITRKKNLIVKSSKYENCMISHDRIIFDQNWYKAISKLNNKFDVLVFPVRGVDNSEYRINDWEFYDDIFLNYSNFKLFPMNYNEWKPNAMIYGGAFAIKQKIHLSNPLNERLYWNEAEDVLQSEYFRIIGITVELVSDAILYSTRIRIKGYKDNFLSNVINGFKRKLLSGKRKIILRNIISTIKNLKRI